MAVISRLGESVEGEKSALSEELAAARASAEMASSDAEAANDALQSKLVELNELRDRLSSLTTEASTTAVSELASTRVDLEEKVGSKYAILLNDQNDSHLFDLMCARFLRSRNVRKRWFLKLTISR